MSARRTRNESYTARLQRRTAVRPTPLYEVPEVLRLPWLPVVAALLAEAGHLVAAFVVWPTSTPSGVAHVVAAGLLGLLATGVHYGVSRNLRVAGLVVVLVLAIGWVLAAGLGAVAYPHLVFLVVAVVEVALAGLLALTPRSPSRG